MERGVKVAIKVLRGAPSHRSELHEQTKEKLVTRGARWIDLNHPNILPFIGINYGHGYLPALVLPWCDLGNVLEFLNKNSRDEKGILRLIYDAAKGLVYLHDRDIVHGDLRAANILVRTTQNDEIVACIADYELTFVIDHAEFTTNKVAGPARWTAPELLDVSDNSDTPYSKASDIFAFSMTMVEIFTRKPPFSNVRNDSAVIFKIIGDQRPEIPTNCPGNVTVRQIIEKAWSKSPVNRPTAAEICQTCKTILEPTWFDVGYQIVVDLFQFYGTYFQRKK